MLPKAKDLNDFVLAGGDVPGWVASIQTGKEFVAVRFEDHREANPRRRAALETLKPGRGDAWESPRVPGVADPTWEPPDLSIPTDWSSLDFIEL